MNEAVLTALHHLLALALAATLATELTLIRRDMNDRALRQVMRVHVAYLLLFAALFIVGLLRASLGPQGLAQTWTDPVFALKLAALGLALLVQIPAGLRLYRWRRLAAAMPGVPPRLWEIRHVRHWLHAGAFALAAVPLLAAFVARPAP